MYHRADSVVAYGAASLHAVLERAAGGAAADGRTEVVEVTGCTLHG